MPVAAITDYTFADVDLERAALEQAGCRLDARRCTDTAELIDLTAEADVVITQFARLDATVIGAMKRARVIARYGIGVDNVDLDAARAKGIPVCNVPDYCIDEVADHTLAMVLDLTRRVAQTSDGVHAGAWKLPVAIEQMRSLRDLTVGIVGFGRIGREVARRLAAFKPTILIYDPVVRPADISAAGFVPVRREELLQSSDLITLHCPSTASTKRMINADSLAACKRGVLLVNLARGDLIDTAALVEALGSGQVGAAALDVCDPEPIPRDHPLLAMPQVVITPHVASVSPRAVKALRDGVVASALRALRREPQLNIVNGVPATAAAAAKT
ncbi:MAG: C-terminal binding protein [Planctomycetes bacterium]|nr:C-terminal binding protein [Planctomycetota bacterium]